MSLHQLIAPKLADQRVAQKIDQTVSLNAAVNMKTINSEKVSTAMLELFQNTREFSGAVFEHPNCKLNQHKTDGNESVNWTIGGKCATDVSFRSIEKIVAIDQVMVPLDREALLRNTKANVAKRKASGFGMGAKDSLEILASGGYEVGFIYQGHNKDDPDEIVRHVAKVTKEPGCMSDSLVVEITHHAGEGRFDTKIPVDLPTMRTYVKCDTDAAYKNLVAGTVKALSRFDLLHHTYRVPHTEAEQQTQLEARKKATVDRLLALGIDEEEAKDRVKNMLLPKAFPELVSSHYGTFRDKQMYVPKIGNIAGIDVKLPNAFSVLVGGIFTAHDHGTGAAPNGLVMEVPGRGLPNDQFPIFQNHFRKVDYTNGTHHYSLLMGNLLDSAHTKEQKSKIREWLKPLFDRSKTPLINMQKTSYLSWFLKDDRSADGLERLQKLLVGKNMVPCTEENVGKASFLAQLDKGKTIMVVDEEAADPDVFKVVSDITLEKRACKSMLGKWAGNPIQKAGHHFLAPVIKYLTKRSKHMHLYMVHPEDLEESAPKAVPYNLRRVVTDIKGEDHEHFVIVIHEGDEKTTVMDALYACNKTKEETVRMTDFIVCLNNNNIVKLPRMEQRLREALKLARKKHRNLDIGDPLNDEWPSDDEEDGEEEMPEYESNDGDDSDAEDWEDPIEKARREQEEENKKREREEAEEEGEESEDTHEPEQEHTDKKRRTEGPREKGMEDDDTVDYEHFDVPSEEEDRRLVQGDDDEEIHLDKMDNGPKAVTGKLLEFNAESGLFHEEGAPEPDEETAMQYELRKRKMALAKAIVSVACGLGRCKVYGAIAPSANWDGLHCADGRIFLNLSKETLVEYDVMVLAHELAHEKRDLHDHRFVEAMQDNFVKILSLLKRKPNLLKE